MIIAEGRMAVILGAEVPGLGFDRFSGDSVESQVADLWNLGIRKVTPVHGTDNPLGGTAFFDDNYNTATFFEGSGRENGSWANWSPGGLFETIGFALSAVFPPPFSGLILEDAWTPGEQWANGSWFYADGTDPATIVLPFPMQIGSGTFDWRPGLTYIGHADRLSWGSQVLGTIRTGKNSSGWAATRLLTICCVRMSHRCAPSVSGYVCVTRRYTSTAAA